MGAKHKMKVLGNPLPDVCPKCGCTQFQAEGDEISCFNCGWVCYLSEEQITALNEGGLDKTRTVCKDVTTGRRNQDAICRIPGPRSLRS